MAYEEADFVNELDKDLPRGSDSISEGDIHIRTIKKALLETFPSISSKPVRSIHSGPDSEKPTTGIGAGDVFYNTTNGLIYIYNGIAWRIMAHGDHTGVGQMLQLEWYTSTGFSFRTNENEIFDGVINGSDNRPMAMFTPLSTTSTLFLTATAETGVWSQTPSAAIWGRFMDVDNGDQIGSDFRIIGFNHVDDAGTFEIYGNMNMMERWENHPGGTIRLGLVVWSTEWDQGGGGIHKVRMEVREVE